MSNSEIHTITSVFDSDIERLSPHQAVDFFRRLLWAEVTRVGLPITNVQISLDIFTPDGGIDASVDGDQDLPRDSFLIKGITGFQIKTGKNFKPWQPKQITKELFGSKNPGKKNLGDAIRILMEKGGRYVIVCLGDELPSKIGKAEKLISKLLSECEFRNPDVEVWDRSHMLGILQRFPSLSLELNGRGRSNFFIQSNWEKTTEMKKLFFAGEDQNNFISNLQHLIRSPDRSVHIRVLGEAGIGKTRLVMESTKADDVAPLVIYCSSPKGFFQSDLMNEFTRRDKKLSAVLVVDECSQEYQARLWDSLQYAGERLRLITINNEIENIGGTTKILEVPPLKTDQISQIIQSYNIPKDESNRWADFCGGSPRAAHILGENLSNNPEDIWKDSDTVPVWDRYIVGGDDPSSQMVNQRHFVLRFLSLFKRFGFGRNFTDEMSIISRSIQDRRSDIHISNFEEIVNILRQRKILQGENTLYITPKLLHIKLWVEWWNIYGSTFDVEDFIKKLTPTLQKWFFEMFKYATESKIASQIVDDLLGSDGPFEKNDYLKDENGANFFLALSEANPYSALKCLEITIGRNTPEQLLEFKIGRRQVVWALERIVIHKDLFIRAAQILLALGEAESESISNNASGIFTHLFSPAPGRVAPTQASPEERFPILLDALKSNSKARRTLGLRACNSALATGGFSRMIGAEYQGIRVVGDFWKPKTWGELFDAYRRVWKLLIDLIPEMQADEREEAITILLQNTRGLASMANLTDMVLEGLHDILDKGFVDKKKVLVSVITILHYDAKTMEQEQRKMWEQFRDNLIGEGFSSRLRRHVGMRLIDDEFDETGKRMEEPHKIIRELAIEVVENPELLKGEFDWLVTAEAENGIFFGYELGKLDQNFSFMDDIIQAQRKITANRSVFFLGGYLHALFERDRNKWENKLDELSKVKELSTWVPELTWRSGMTETASRRVLRLAQEGKIEIDNLRLFGYGFVIKEISENTFKEWFEYLYNLPTVKATRLLLDLFNLYYLEKRSIPKIPEKETYAVLTHPLLIDPQEYVQPDHMMDYSWTQIAKAFIKEYPSKALNLSEFILKHFGKQGSIFDRFISYIHEVLNEITRLNPDKVWKQVKKYIRVPTDSRTFYIAQWLRGELSDLMNTPEGAFYFFPWKLVSQWIDEKVKDRAWFIAYYVPPRLFKETGKICYAREVLVSYGEREDVRRNLTANFYTEGSIGPESHHLQRKMDSILDYKKNENNRKVLQWINEYISSLEINIERAKIEEERRDY